MSGTGSADASDVCCVVEHAETMTFEHVHEFDKLHSEAEIGLVGTVVLHGVGPGHALEGLGDFDSADGFEQVLGTRKWRVS